MFVRMIMTHINALLLIAAIVLIPGTLQAQASQSNPGISGQQQQNSSIPVGPVKITSPGGITEIKPDNTPLPDCDALIKEYWEIYNSGNCKRAYEMLGVKSHERTSFDDFMKSCDPETEKERLLRRLQVKYSTNKVTSCIKNRGFMPEALVIKTELLPYDSILTSMANSLEWSSDSDKIPAESTEARMLTILKKMADEDSVPPEKLKSSSVKYYFSYEDGIWKLEIPHLYWISTRNSNFASVFKLIEEGKYVEANALLRDKTQEKYIDKSYPLLLSAVMELNRMRNTRFPVDITDVAVKINDGKVNISGNLVNRGSRPLTGVMAKVYYLDNNGNVLIANEFLLLSTLGVTFPKITGQVDANSRKPFSINFYNFPKGTGRVWLTVSGYTD